MNNNPIDEVREGVEREYIERFHIPELLVELFPNILSRIVHKRQKQLEKLYNLCSEEVAEQKSGGIYAKVVVMGDGVPYCHAEIPLEERVGSWLSEIDSLPEVEGWYIPPRRHYQKGAFGGYEMISGEPWARDQSGGARIILSRDDLNVKPDYYMILIYAHPAHLEEAIDTALTISVRE
ncbi:hypothetical protein A3K72_02295 [Candidatus Woesearchaeota archaeon RBG_13_36_6]|nr:MAG: hypothetical protein A3K72_02295 [Candidatus Woesearchaeota archaeon RBG_13_36_6]